MSLPEHPFYKPVENIADADAVGYAFLDKTGDPVPYPFKFPELQADDVRIKIHHTGLCMSDCHTVRNLWGYCLHPAVPGHEVAGHITMVGSDVKDFKVGDYVGASPLRNFCENCEHCKRTEAHMCQEMPGEEKYLYNPYFGGYATHIQLKARATVKIPENIKPNDACTLLCAGVTVYNPISRFYTKGEKCAVVGIGGLGHLAIQFANKLGMEVTAFSGTTSKKELCQKIGAVDLKSSIDLDELKKEEGKYALVVHTLPQLNADLQKAHQRLTKPQGTFAIVGLPSIDETAEFDCFYTIMNEIKISGGNIGSPALLNAMLDFSSKNGIQPIYELFEFEDFPKAFNKLEHGRPMFRCVVDVKSYSEKNGIYK